MSFGISRISKGKVQQAIESVVNNAELRPQFLVKLKQDRSTETADTDWIAFLRHPEAGNLQPTTEQYFREQWLQAPAWQSFKVEPIVRQSLIKAIELANNPIRPIENYWIWMDGPERFEIVLHESARQVTRIIVTSPLNQVPPGVDLNNMRVDPETPELPFWVIKRYGEAPTPESVLDREKDKNPTEGWSVVQLLPIPS